jgi:hypothetical protein
VKKVSLDALVKASLDVSVPQIGAPAAWAAGYDGKGVKVAVVDTGIDTRHADLAPQVVAEKNFTDSPDTQDHVGHGTHVASTVAGTGAESQGTYKGVAPGAELLNAKVLNDSGFGTDSSIIAGMEWAVDQGAKVINASLESQDTEGVDPVEETVNRLSDKALFVIAAGNSGPGVSTVGSPGSADSALTVGAVDKTDALADFSARGPRVGDGAVKPDLTAPGVDITAAAAEGSLIDTDPGTPHPAPGYLTISGTSMATPHVAGAAALLAQEHPDWTGQRIKAALVGSVKPGPYAAYEQGSGRVDVATAVKQTVVAESGSLSFGTQQWPHTDDTPVSNTVTYRNTGAQDVTLTLSGTGTGPSGAALPQGFLTLGSPQVTVPAGGTASVGVTLDSRLGGTVYGAYSLAVTATGGGQTVRTVGAVNREEERYEIDFKANARDGHAPAEGAWVGIVYGLDNNTQTYVSGADGSAKLRLPKGDYTVLGYIPLMDSDGVFYIGEDYTVQPKLKLTKNTAFPVDARRTKKLDISVPDKAASQVSGYVTIAPKENGTVIPVNIQTDPLPEGFRTQQIGPPTPASELTSSLTSVWSSPTAEYHVANTLKGAFYTGFTEHAKRSDFAELTVRQGASVQGRQGLLLTSRPAPDLPYASFSPVPSSRTVYVQGGYSWEQGYNQALGRNGENFYNSPQRVYAAGKQYTQSFNTGVAGPVAGEGLGLVREGNQLTGRVPLFGDGAGHNGDSLYDPLSASTTLYRNGKKFATSADVMDYASFELPKDRATYKLAITASRDESLGATVSTKVSTEYTFSSAYAKTAVSLPASVVRYTPQLALDSTARARAELSVPVTVEGPAAGRNLRSLSVHVSYDRGATWSGVPVHDGKVTVRNPKAGGSVSFKADVEDRTGNKLSQTIIDAYRTK